MKRVILAALVFVPLFAAERKLVWSDEFDGTGAPETGRWTYERGFIRNRERQLYTDRVENVRRSGGMLIIEALKERMPNPAYAENSTSSQKKEAFANYTSGSITTKPGWKYGRIEVRAKLPTGRGTWPAIWMLGANCGSVGWPKCGEIDIMENVGFDPDVIQAAIHTEAYNHVQNTDKTAKITIPKPYADFHIYALEWTPDRMDFFVDEKKYFTYTNEKTGTAAWPFDQPFHLKLNIAIGGGWGGQKGIDDSIFPQRMEVDYVRVYQ